MSEPFSDPTMAEVMLNEALHALRYAVARRERTEGPSPQVVGGWCRSARLADRGLFALGLPLVLL